MSTLGIVHIVNCLLLAPYKDESEAMKASPLVNIARIVTITALLLIFTGTAFARRSMPRARRRSSQF